ncbi:DUF4004 family protein [Alloiococcus sp. CFN-8]|uniref:DUF4004 family protein n=1 Tax=Alloiococcus sp. CFN-8 TaxID=3416081 RepID=UPI003CE8001E
MEEKLISKKELLEMTDISYGQLYRWKRKNIIPEEWFIKKSSYTGQETFFPRDKILERINKIKALKDDQSLDELAEQFSLKPAEILLNRDELLKSNIVSDPVLSLYERNFGSNESYDFEVIMELHLLDSIIKTGDISFDEGIKIINTYKAAKGKKEEKPLRLIYLRKYGIGVTLFGAMPFNFIVEDEAKVVIDIEMAGKIESLKTKLLNREAE